MESEHRDKQIPVFKLDGRKNKMEFIRGFKQVADHFGITIMVYEDTNRPADEDEAGSQARWDTMNRIALEKLRFYVTTRVDDMAGDQWRRTNSVAILPETARIVSKNRVRKCSDLTEEVSIVHVCEWGRHLFMDSEIRRNLYTV